MLERRRWFDILVSLLLPVLAKGDGVGEGHIFHPSLPQGHRSIHRDEPTRGQELGVVLSKDKVCAGTVKTKEVGEKDGRLVVGVN